MSTPRATRKKNRNLTVKQRRFVQALPTAVSATQAALAAGYSPKAAAESASDTLKKPYIQAALAKQARLTGGVMTLLKRKERLSELALPNPEHPDPVAAIKELNHMESVGLDRSMGVQFVVDAEMLRLMAEPETRRLLEALAGRLSVGRGSSEASEAPQ